MITCYIKSMRPLRSKRTRTSGPTMPEDEDLSPISCEVCRQRKCKCDRHLPFCSQCSAEPSNCIYPESGKRGLPPGYLNRLEQRLAETESALYGALITLRSMGPTRVAHASTRPDAVPKQKAARMEEWSQLPLQVSSGMDRWLAVMSNQFTIEPSLDMPPHGVSGSDYSMPKPLGHSNTPGDARGPPAPSVWTAREGNSAESPYEAHRYAQTIVPSPLYSDTQALVGSNGVASPSIGSGMSEHGVPEEGTVEIHQSTKAEQLTNNHPSIYF